MHKDRTTEVLLDALRQALGGPPERRLYRSGKLDGLFPGKTGANGEAAALALREGLLEVVRTETRGKSTWEWVRLTPAGVDYLHAQESPLRALEDLRELLRLNLQAIPVWLNEMRQQWQQLGEQMEQSATSWSTQLTALQSRVEERLRQLEALRPLLPDDVETNYPWANEALSYLERRHRAGAPVCELAELFSALGREYHELTVATFHAGLKQLQEVRALRLVPVDAAEILAQPEFALLVGGEVLTAVCLRSAA